MPGAPCPTRPPLRRPLSTLLKGARPASGCSRLRCPLALPGSRGFQLCASLLPSCRPEVIASSRLPFIGGPGQSHPRTARGAAWHAARQAGPLFGLDTGVTMLRASFQFSLPVSAVLAALCPGGGGGEGDPAAILGKVQRLRECFERGDTHSDVENYVESSVRWGKLFPQSGPSVGPAPSWLPTELRRSRRELPS